MLVNLLVDWPQLVCSSVLENFDKFDIGRKFLMMLGSRWGFLIIGFTIACLYID